MAISIFAVLALTAFYLFGFWFVKRGIGRKESLYDSKESAINDRTLISVYVGLSCLALLWMLARTTGNLDPPSPWYTRHFEYQGVSIQMPVTDWGSTKLILSGGKVPGSASAFKWFALPSEGHISLEPVESHTDAIRSFRASCVGVSHPVRLNDVCINDPLGGWIPTGGSGSFHIESYRTVSQGNGRHWLETTAVPLTLSPSTGSVEISSAAEAVRHRLTVRHWISLADALAESGCRALLAKLSSLTDSDGRPMITRVFLVRKTDESSELGLVSALPAAKPVRAGSLSGSAGEPATAIFPDDQRDSSKPVVSLANGGFRLTSVGSGRAESSLWIPSELEKGDRELRARFLFDPPRSYSLPPEKDLTRSNGLITLSTNDTSLNADGYIFDTGVENDPVTLYAKLSGDPPSVKLLGRNFAPASATNVVEPLNQAFTLGNSSVSPIVCFADPLANHSPDWLIPAAGILIGGAVLIGGLFFAKGRDRLREIRRGYLLPMLWVSVVALLAVRCVLAFRVSAMPPFNIGSNEARSYAAPWLYAEWATLLFGIFGAVVAVSVVRSIEKRSGDDRGRLNEFVVQKGLERGWIWASRFFYAAALVVAALVLVQKVFDLTVPLFEPGSLQIGVLFLILGFGASGLSQIWDQPEGDENPDTAPVVAPFSQSQSTSMIAGGAAVGVALVVVGLLRHSAMLNVLGALVGFGGWYLSDRQRLDRARVWSTRNILALAAVATLLADSGTFVFGIPLVISGLVGAVVRRVFKDLNKRVINIARLVGAPGAALLCAVLAIAAVPVARPLIAAIGRDLAAGGEVAPLSFLSSALPYRFAAGESDKAAELLSEPKPQGTPFNSRVMLETLHQKWQMHEYLLAAPTGYFGAPLKNVGMTYSTMLSDASFSVFLVGEHGKWAALWVLGLHLTIGLIFFLAAADSIRSQKRRGNVVALYAIGAVFAFVAIYMALANLWLVPFTGQNIPLLSLRSRTDLVLFLGLATYGGLLIGFPFGNDGRPDRRSTDRASALTPFFWLFPAAVAFGWVCLAGSLLTDQGDPARSFNLSNQNYDRIVKSFSDGRKELREHPKEFRSLGDTPAITAPGPFLVAYAQAFQSGDVTGSPVQIANGATGTLAANRRFFLVTSPFDERSGVTWRGEIVADQPTPRRQLLIQGKSEPVDLVAKSGTGWLTLGGKATSKSVVDTLALAVIDPTTRQASNYGGIRLQGNDVVLDYNDTSLGKQARVLVNEVHPEVENRSIVLTSGDVVTLRLNTAKGAQSVSVRYVGASDGRLAAVVWRNGSYRRVFPQGSDLPLVYSIAEAGDDLARSKVSVPASLNLSVNLGLQHDLQAALVKWGKAKNRAVDRGASSADGLPFTAVVVMELGSGKLRAVAAIPKRDPNEDIESVSKDFPNEDEAIVSARSSWALRNRTIGSTFKPMSFVALASQFNSKSFDICNLKVNENSAVDGDRYRRLGDLTLSEGVALQAGRSLVDMESYLRRSRTWPAVVTATLGLIDSPSELPLMLHTGQAGGLEVGDAPASLTPLAALSKSGLSSGRLDSQTIASSLWMKGLFECYAPNIVPFTKSEKKLSAEDFLRSFLAPLDLSKVSDLSLRSLASPQPHWADATELTDFDTQLVRYMFGGGENRWNAVSMATNDARITSGRCVQATLSGELSKSIPPLMPGPVANPDWRYEHILKPMFEIQTFEGADALRSETQAHGYRIAMKSGTIDDGNGRESEMLMFTLGKFNGTAFDPARSVSCFVSIRSSKPESGPGDEMVKGDLGKVVVAILDRYLDDRTKS